MPAAEQPTRTPAHIALTARDLITGIVVTAAWVAYIAIALSTRRSDPGGLTALTGCLLSFGSISAVSWRLVGKVEGGRHVAEQATAERLTHLGDEIATLSNTVANLTNVIGSGTVGDRLADLTAEVAEYRKEVAAVTLAFKAGREVGYTEGTLRVIGHQRPADDRPRVG